MPWDWDKLKQKQQGYSRTPPQVDEFLNRLKHFKFPGLRFPVIVGAIIIIWLLTGIYVVAPDEVGVVKRFGRLAYTTGPGPHYHLPIPIESVMKPKVTKVRRIEIGFRTIYAGPPARYKDVPDESLMLTGDENIVDVKFIVQYRIKDAAAYLFNVVNPEKTVRDASEAVMREVIGKNRIDEVLTTGKFRIQEDVATLLQHLLDVYGTGLDVVAVQLQDVHPPQQVIDAFKDVASAKEDKIKFINEAEGYRNDLLPRAKGEAAQMINKARAYRASKIDRAKGDASRFTQLLKEYKKAKEITKKRLYIETMEKIVQTADTIIIEEGVGKNLVPILPLMKELSVEGQGIRKRGSK
nr:FtsH protease activity modulator HflK [Desulfobacterales bacterium]